MSTAPVTPRTEAGQEALAALGVAKGATLSHSELFERLAAVGVQRSSPLFAPALALLKTLPDPLSPHDVAHLKAHSLFVSRALDKELVFADWPHFTAQLDAVFEETAKDRSGANATYIPQLARVNPEQWGAAVCSVDGQQWTRGDSDVYFCIQSVSKAITYALILEEHGEDKVHQHIGREPSGVGFNERVLNADGLPHNPCINSGAIMAASLVKPELDIADRFDYIMDTWTRICGGGRPTFANSTYLSERATADRNFCLAYMMQEEGAFPKGTSLIETLELYFMLCSIEVSASMLSLAAATLASGGVCPTTGDRVFSEQTVRNTLSLVASCGMYDASGQFIFDIGFPAKSGVGGGLLIVLPGKCGISTFSPRLESHGNSARGVLFCEQLATRLDFHQFSIKQRLADRVELTPEQLSNELLFAAQRNDLPYVRVCVARGVNVNQPDYDERTALHIAASEGHAAIVAYLLAHGADRTAKDRFGATPIDDTEREKRADCAKLLAETLTYKAVYAADGSGDYPPFEDESESAVHVRIFASLDDDANGTVRANTIAAMLRSSGYDSDNDKTLRPLFKQLKNGDKRFSREEFLPLLGMANGALVRAAMNNVQLADFGEFEQTLTALHAEMVNVSSGEVATYIPTLAKQDPKKWAVAACSVSGQQVLLGDYDDSWCVQSTCKVVNYLVALDLLGEEAVHKHVSKEPSGRNFNQLCLDKNNLPHNPVINAGAIMTVSLIKPELTASERFSYIKAQWKRLTGGSEVGFDNETYLSEADTAHRNWTLAYMMLDAGAFPDYIKNNNDLKNTLELYFMTCSLTITAQQMAIVGATLANGGVNPLTNERVFSASNVRNCLSIMASCGLYDYSGEFAFKVGVPAKSGVAGGIVTMQPGVVGLCTWSPPLGKLGNSVRGVRFLEALSRKYNIHVYDTLTRNKRDASLHGGSNHDDLCAQLLFAAGNNDPIGARKALSLGIDPSAADYDMRTALHVASAEGNTNVVRLLLENGAQVGLKDRWGKTPLDEATANKHDDIIQLLSNPP